MLPIDPDEITSITPTPAAPPPGAPEPAAAPLVPPASPPVYEPALAWAPAAPVVRAGARRRGGRIRWAVALALVALVVGASAVVAALLVGRSPSSTVIGYVPDKTVLYAELRLDLPGDQRQAAGEFLAKFPGFADQAALDGKLDEVLDDLIKDATKGQQSYTTDIKPWFGGQFAASLGPLPASASIATDPAQMANLRALAILSVKDPALAQAWFDAEFKKAGLSTTSQAYGGTSLTLFSETGGPKAAFAIIDGKVAVLGDETSVRAAVETGGHGGFATSAGPKAALAAADSDHIGFAYAEVRTLVQWSKDLDKSLGSSGAAGMTQLPASLIDLVPEWGAYWIRVEKDALVMEAVAPTPASAVKPAEARSSTVADHIPSSAVVAAIANDYGTRLKQTLDRYVSDPAFKGSLGGLDQALGIVGGTDAALGWIGDTAIVVDLDGGTPDGGLIVQPTDAKQAKQFLTSLKSLIALGGSQVGATVREEAYAGTTITIVDLGPLAGLAAKAGLPAGTVKGGDHLEIAFAATDDVVVVGSGPGFVKHVLDTTKASSLGGNDRYQALVKRAGSASSTTFVDIAAIRVAIEKVAATTDPAGFARYQKDLQPFVEPFDAAITSESTQGDLSHGTVIITVK